MTIFEKLSNIQAELKVPKNRTGKGVFYKYRSCEDIQENAKPICKKYKTLLLISEDIELIGDRYYIKATASLYDLDDPKQYLFVTALVREAESIQGQSIAQLSGTTSSYAKKRCLANLFQIDDSEDDAEEPQDSAESAQRLDTNRKPETSKAPEPQKKLTQSEPQKATGAEDDKRELLKAEINAAAKRTNRKGKEIVGLVEADGFDFKNPDHFDGIINYLKNLKPAKTDLFD